MARIWLLSLTALWASAASAQDATSQDALADCPAFPAEMAESMRWDIMRVPGILVCRALQRDNGEEAFVLTISRESPFRPRRGDRAESTTQNGREVQWYRGDVPNEPNVQIRETLIRVGEELVVHVYLRTTDAQVLAARQQMVMSLPLPVYEED